MDKSDFEQLADKYVQNELSDAEAARLLEHLENGSDFAQELFRQVRSDVQIRDFLGVSAGPASEKQTDSPPPELRLDELCRLEVLSPPLLSPKTEVDTSLSSSSSGVRSKNGSNRWDLPRPLFLSALISIALLWLVLCTIEFLPVRNELGIGDECPPVLAVIDRSDDPVWSSATPAYRRGEVLRAEPLSLIAGLFSLKLRDGTSVIVEPGTDLDLRSPNELACSQGKMSFRVPPRKEALEVVLPHCNVVVLGTSFFVQATPQSSEIHLVEGRLKLNGFIGNPDEEKTIEAGQALRVDAQGKILLLETDPELLYSEQLLRQKDRSSLNRERDRWFASREHWKRDRSLLLEIDFQKDDSFETLPDRITPEIHGGNEVAGRFSGKTGMQFSGEDDFISFEMPQSLQSFTLTTSLRLDRFEQRKSTLFTSEKNTRGAVYWQITQGGYLVLGVNDHRMKLFRNPYPLVEEHVGLWLHLAVVVDRQEKTVTHYVNGRKTGMDYFQDEFSVQVERGLIGRGAHENRTNGFTGSMDEFRLYARPLSENEIQGIVEGL